MNSPIVPKVSLVGAGPGSGDLITLRGIRTLAQADIILYDALVGEEILRNIDKSIPKLFVGKRCGKHSYKQKEINHLLVEKAFTHGHVVRLKGGDPFVFGRASEEIEYVESFGIPVVVVPGVSSAIALPSNQGIPLTKRGVSTSFWVLTGTKQDGSLSQDLKLAAQSSATMVVLMGLRKLKAIATEVRTRRNGLTPMAVIQNGTLPDERCITTTLNEVERILPKIDTSLPGILVIGDVVAEHPAFFEEEVQRVLNTNL